jgi:hypothetical protein
MSGLLTYAHILLIINTQKNDNRVQIKPWDNIEEMIDRWLTFEGKSVSGCFVCRSPAKDRNLTFVGFRGESLVCLQPPLPLRSARTGTTDVLLVLRKSFGWRFSKGFGLV